LISDFNDNPRRLEMLTKTAIAFATALTLGIASVALAAPDTDQKGGARTFGGPGGGATQGVNSAYHANAAVVCSKKYKSYDSSDMTFLGKDGQRHPCS
jgi:BA14K-like protein